MDPDSRGFFKKISEESDKVAKNFNAQFDQFRNALQTQPNLIGNREIVDWIKRLFNQRGLESEDPDFALLMDSLSFTSTPIPVEQIPHAWATFQDSNEDINILSYEEYPILEGMAQWYFEHRDDPGRVDMEMVARSLSVYEHLIQELRGREADPFYEDVLAGIGVTVVAQYCGIRNFERAKFYVHLLEQEYFALRMKDEDYLCLMGLYEQIMVQEKGESLSTVERELHRINRLCWDTISDRDRQIETFSDESAQLREEIARTKTNPDLESARQRLSQQCRDTWNKFHVVTRTHLELGCAVIHAPLSGQIPGIVPTSFFLAVKSELLACLFKPHGQLDSEFLKRNRASSPIDLLIKYAERKSPFDERKLLRERGGPSWLDSMFHSLSGASQWSDYAAVSRVVRLS